MVDLEDIGYKNARDVAFLEGYHDPMLAVLHENERTWAGRVAVVHHTASITTISLDISQRRQYRNWSVNRLPHELNALVAVPAPAGGVLAVSSSALLYCDRGVRCAMKISEYATIMGDGGIRYDSAEDQEPLLLAATPPVHLDGYQFLFSHADGRVFVATLRLDDDGNAERGIEFREVPVARRLESGAAACITKLAVGPGYLFLASRLGDSSLLRISKGKRNASGALSVSDVGAVASGGGLVTGTIKAEAEPASTSSPSSPATKAASAKAEVDRSDEDLYGPGSGAEQAQSEVKAKAEPADDDSDDDLYGGGGGGDAAAPSGDGDDAKIEDAAAAGGNGAGAGASLFAPMEFDDDEEAAMYAAAPAAAAAVGAREAIVERDYTLVEVDSLLNVGPAADISLCPHRRSPEDEKKDSMTMVTTSGGGPFQKLTTVQRGIVPVVSTAVDLPTATAVWTVLGAPPEEDEGVQESAEVKGAAGETGSGGDEMETEGVEQAESEDAPAQGSGGGEVNKGTGKAQRVGPGEHAYMVISLGGEEPGTIVLKGRELEEFDESEVMDFYTGGATICVANLLGSRRIVQVTPWNVVLLRGAKKELELPLVAGSQVVAAWVLDPYVALLLQDGALLLIAADEQTLQLNFVPSAHIQGVTAGCMFRSCGAGGEAFLAVATRKGALQIFSVPALELVAEMPYLALGNVTLMDALVLPKEMEIAGIEEIEPPLVMNVGIEFIPGTSDPLLGSCACLVAITAHGDLLVYKSFRHVVPVIGDESAKRLEFTSLRFRKEPHDFMLRGKMVWDDMFVDELERGDPTREASLQELRTSRLMPLGGVGGLHGILVAARSPCVVIFSRGAVRVTAWKLDRNEGVRSSTRYCSTQCPDGIVCIADRGKDRARGMLKICEVPAGLRVDSPWPARSHFVGYSVHHIAFHAPTGCHVAIVSKQTPIKEERLPEDFKEVGHVPELTAPTYMVQLLAPHSFEVLDTLDDLFEVDGETALCIQVVHLKNTQKRDALLPYVAIGTGFLNGETECSRACGRLYVVEITSVIGAEGYEGKQIYKLKKNWSSADLQDIKAPVTAVAQLEGYLVVGQGPNPGMIGGSKLYVYEWAEEKLVGRAFYDSYCYVTSLKTVKHFVIMTDVRHSLIFLRWREDVRMLQLLARDVHPLNVTACEFLVIGNQLGFLAADDNRNMQVFIFNPTSAEYRKQQLACRADIHSGGIINKFLRWPMPFNAKTGVRLAVHFATLDGAVGAVIPLTEKSYRRLLALQNLLVNAMPHIAGLNPRSWRLYKSAGVMKRRFAKNFLDGTLLARFLHLPLPLQVQLAGAMGQERDTVLGDLFEIIMSSSIV